MREEAEQKTYKTGQGLTRLTELCSSDYSMVRNLDTSREKTKEKTVSKVVAWSPANSSDQLSICVFRGELVLARHTWASRSQPPVHLTE